MFGLLGSKHGFSPHSQAERQETKRWIVLHKEVLCLCLWGRGTGMVEREGRGAWRGRGLRMEGSQAQEPAARTFLAANPASVRLWKLAFVSVCACSVVSDSLPPQWTAACQNPRSMEFSRQEYWNGLTVPPLGDLPDPGIKPTPPLSPALTGGFFTTEPPGKPF